MIIIKINYVRNVLGKTLLLRNFPRINTPFPYFFPSHLYCHFQCVFFILIVHFQQSLCMWMYCASIFTRDQVTCACMRTIFFYFFAFLENRWKISSVDMRIMTFQYMLLILSILINLSGSA
jgi:hypothetical protein